MALIGRSFRRKTTDTTKHAGEGSPTKVQSILGRAPGELILRLSGARGGLRRSRLSCPGSTGQSCAKAPVRPRMPDRRLERDTGPPACRGASGASRRCQRAALMSGRAVRALWAKGCLWARMPSLRAARRTVGIPRRKAYNNVRWAWMGNALFAFARRSASPRGFVSLRRGEH